MYIVYTNSNPNSLYPIMIHDAYPDYIVIKIPHPWIMLGQYMGL